jgi:putative ABC transport system permease protein
MAFIIKRRTREIAIRKVHGAGVGEIVRMLNVNFIRWIVLAFIVAAPISGIVIHNWLQNFAYKTPVSWWIFLLAGVTVLMLSLVSVSVQSWRAAITNPAEVVKSE